MSFFIFFELFTVPFRQIRYSAEVKNYHSVIKRLKVQKLFLTDIDADELFGPVNHTGTPERNLLMAVLTRAILDYVGNDRREIESATEWIFAADEQGDDFETPYTFRWLCQQLDLDRADIAEKIKRMPKRGKRRVAPWYFTRREEEQRLAG